MTLHPRCPSLSTPPPPMFDVAVQLALTLALTRILSKLFSYLNQPVVIGEVVAGIIMGPSVLGHIPGACRYRT